MKRFALTLILATLASPALADDATTPVKAIMDVAVATWSESQPDGIDYFDDAHISAYSKDFVAAYKEAAKHPAFDEEGSGPFDYDVITDSQDGCSIKDLKIEPSDEAAGVTDVKVTYKFWTCSEEADQKDSVNEVHFNVVLENGKPVIADILRKRDDGNGSLMDEMKLIAAPQ